MHAKLSAASLRARFPILENVVFVNHAALSPWPRDTVLAVRDYTDAHHRNGPLVYGRWLRTAQRLREVAATLLNAPSPGDISLLSNTSDGINTLVQAIDWRPGNNVVTLRHDFPSNALPWQALERQGVELRRVDARHVAEPESALLQRMDEQTRVLAVSSVDWVDGFRLDLGRLGTACRAAGVLLFVDAIQHLGALQLDVQAEQIDVLAAGSHKWQLGPEGMGLFYSRAAVRDRLDPARLGWHMLEDRFEFSRPGRAPARDGRKFEAGTPNRLGQVALLASLHVLQDYGMDEVERRVLSNTGQLIDSLQAMGLEVLSATEGSRRSGIVSFRAPSVEPDRLLSALTAQSIHAVRRGQGIRLSPHFYQGKREMEQVLEGIENAVRSLK
jgi:selenocysteine lyase/cysteine desulfurase